LLCPRPPDASGGGTGVALVGAYVLAGEPALAGSRLLAGFFKKLTEKAATGIQLRNYPVA
jgi:hypothetical protein